MIIHPMVDKAECTCVACPDQWEGTLTNGQQFYFRYRSGWVSLGLGESHGAAIDDSMTRGRSLGDSLQGIFDSDEQRNEVFAELLAERLAA